MNKEIKTSEHVDDLDTKNICVFIRQAIENKDEITIITQRRKLSLPPKEIKKVCYFGDDLLITYHNGKMILLNPQQIAVVEVS